MPTGEVPPRVTRRYGPSEIYGRAVAFLDASEIRSLTSALHRSISCPFKPDNSPCSKKGGICSLVLLERDAEGAVSLSRQFVTTCPSRFLEGGRVFSWVGETLLETPRPLVVTEIPFLMRGRSDTGRGTDEVGRIDHVLVRDEGERWAWCALEMQAVYFSGRNFEDDLRVMRTWTGSGIPFPIHQRRPDFRSSGPKRLMPQLQIKVPTLRRWGKKMAVVVDRAFWGSLRAIRRVADLSNADIIWFVVDYEVMKEKRYQIIRYDAVFTTLENAVEGLTGGDPVSLERFEAAIRRKLIPR